MSHNGGAFRSQIVEVLLIFCLYSTILGGAVWHYIESLVGPVNRPGNSRHQWRGQRLATDVDGTHAYA